MKHQTGNSILAFVFIFVFLFGCDISEKTNTEEISVPGKDETSTEVVDSTDQSPFTDEYLSAIEKVYEYQMDLEEIKQRDTLRAITTYSSTSYFLYKGEPMGYDYELSKRLADYLGVELQLVIADDLSEIIPMLLDGKGDIITFNLTITQSRKNYVDFTHPMNFTHQVLVQRKPDNWRKMKLHEIENDLIRNPIKLLDIPISIRRNSSYMERIINLEEELGGDISVHSLPGNITTDRIIQMVSDKLIDFTIADYNIAYISASYYDNLDVNTNVGIMQQLAWAVRKTSPKLRDAVNNWLTAERKEADFYVIYNKYYKNSRAYLERSESDYFSLEGNKISEYDRLIKNVANTLNWDWRFLAAQAYQESRFDPDKRSWAGAVGLMQLMPKTALSYGYRKLSNPRSSLRAAAKHIQMLDDFWKNDIPDSTERVKFILASYNAGQYHVQDARQLAVKKGLDPNTWYDNVEKTMLLKSDQQYIKDPVVKYGYCRGEEPVNYVKEIFRRYNYYKEFIGIDGSDPRFSSR